MSNETASAVLIDASWFQRSIRLRPPVSFVGSPGPDFEKTVRYLKDAAATAFL
jgi:hypothetical protein